MVRAECWCAGVVMIQDDPGIYRFGMLAHCCGDDCVEVVVEDYRCLRHSTGQAAVATGRKRPLTRHHRARQGSPMCGEGLNRSTKQGTKVSLGCNQFWRSMQTLLPSNTTGCHERGRRACSRPQVARGSRS